MNAKNQSQMKAQFQEMNAQAQEMEEMEAQHQARIQEKEAQFQEMMAQMKAQAQEMDAQHQARIQERDVQFQAMLNAQIAQIKAQFNEGSARLQETFNRIHGLFDRRDLTAARTTANFQRLVNLRIPREGVATPFVLITKYKSGHPFERPRALAGFQWTKRVYELNSQPPANLLPENFSVLESWTRLPAATRMRRMRALLWFYNDPIFEPPPDGATAQWFLNTIRDFLRHPS